MFSGLTLMKDMDLAARLSRRTVINDFSLTVYLHDDVEKGDEQSSDDRGHQRRNVGDA
jgi:hypothetical protein